MLNRNTQPGTAIPKMTSQLNSLNDVGWYGSAYLLTQLSLQSIFGRLYTYFNIRWVYIAALLIFEIGSAICASAPTSSVFILGRAISGTGSAGIYSGSLIIGTNLVTLRQRPLYISIVTSMYGVAAVAGPLLGGVFTDSSRLTWRFCFWINLRKAIEYFEVTRVSLTRYSIRRTRHIDHPGDVQATNTDIS